MTDGVTIIEECRSIPFWEIIILIIIACLIVIVGAKVFDWFRHRDSIIGMILTANVEVVLVFTCMFAEEIPAFTEPNGKLRVVVSDTVDMNAFQEKYEIINFENGAYTVKSKGNGED